MTLMKCTMCGNTRNVDAVPNCPTCRSPQKRQGLTGFGPLTQAQGDELAHEEVANLRERVRELEAPWDAALQHAIADEYARAQRFKAEFERKREECERLEEALAASRSAFTHVVKARDDAERSLARALVECDRLRRELGKRK